MQDPRAQQHDDDHAAIQSIFNCTHCYDLMQNSSKIIVFETAIPFQLAFFALAEHDTEVAPLRDSENRTLVAMITIQDYIQALQVCRLQNVSAMELMTKSISDMMLSPILTFKHVDFQTIDAEDSIYQLFMMMRRLSVDFVPVVDPENGNLVAVLGLLDILHLLNEAAKQHPQYFTQVVANIGVFSDIITAPRAAVLGEVLRVMEDRGLIGIPVTDEAGQVLGVYHRNDIAFITRAADPDAAIANLNTLTVGEALLLSQQQAPAEVLTKVYTTVKCTAKDKVSFLLNSLMMARTTVAVVVSETNACIGMVTVKDVLRYYFDRR